MSDTPETDAEELHDPHLVRELPFCVVRIDFARHLERERNEAREENARLREALADCASHLEGWHTMEALENARKLLTP